MLLPINKRTQVHDSYEYPATRVPSDRYVTFGVYGIHGSQQWLVDAWHIPLRSYLVSHKRYVL